MKIITPYVILTAFIAVILATISFCLTKDPEFFANLLLNIVAEFFGISLGILITAYIAIEIAKKRLKELAPEVVNLIQLLREKENIKPEVARAAVVAFVSLIDEEAFSRDSKICPSSNEHCRVCDLPSETREELGKRKCKKCGLPGEVWATKNYSA